MLKEIVFSIKITRKSLHEEEFVNLETKNRRLRHRLQALQDQRSAKPKKDKFAKTWPKAAKSKVANKAPKTNSTAKASPLGSSNEGCTLPNWLKFSIGGAVKAIEL